MRELRTVAGRLKRFATAYRGKVAGLGAAGLAAACGALEAAVEPLQRATAWAEAALAVDAGDAGALELLERCEALWGAVAERAGFFEQEVAALDGPSFAALLARPELAGYANYLRKVRAAAGRQLPEPAGGILARVDPIGGWERLARQLLARIVVAEGGSRMSLGEALPALYEPDRERRRAVCAAISSALEPEVELRAAALVSLTRVRAALDRERGVTDWLGDEHLANQVTPEEVAALLDAIRARAGVVHRYYQAKAECLGHSLTHADRYAPVGGPGRPVSWSEACQVVSRAFARLGAAPAALVGELLEGGMVDALPREGKRSGAVTFSMPGGDCCVLLNFTGQLRGVLTLAHELGHAVHARMSGHHGALNAAVPAVLAETVALFAEAVTVQAYGQLLDDPPARQALLARWVEDQLVAAFRQLALHDFEAGMVAAVQAGELPDSEALGEAWLRWQRALYGPALELGRDYRHWWSYLDSLFLAPGSRYAYVYGQCAALGLLARHLEDPASFGPRFEQLLRAGATQPPAALLSGLGLRLEEPDGWQPGLEVLLNQMDTLLSHLSGAAAAAPGVGRGDRRGPHDRGEGGERDDHHDADPQDQHRVERSRGLTR